MRADQNESLQADIQKLKDFIKKQTVTLYSMKIELEEWRKKASDMDSNLQNKYHKALKQIELMHKDNVNLKSESNAFRTDVFNWRNKYEALERSSAQELEELRMSMENKRRS